MRRARQYLLLIIVILLLFPTLPIACCNVTSYRVYIGAHGIKDGHSAAAIPYSSANWKVLQCELRNNGDFSIELECDATETPTICGYYDSDIDEQILRSVDLEFVDSVAFVRVWSTVIYPFTSPFGGDSSSTPISDIAFLRNEYQDLETFRATYQGTFDLSIFLEERLSELDLLSVCISWLRIYKDSKENLYYQWMSADGLIGDYEGALWDTNTVYTNISGNFRMYYSKPEEWTEPLNAGTRQPSRIDYVQWVKDNIITP